MGKPMATDTARSTKSPAARHLWQVPAFLLGVAAVLVVMLVIRPRYSTDTLAAAEHQLSEARKALEDSTPDLSGALSRTKLVIAQADKYPQLSGEAHFLAGSAHLRLADEPGADTPRERQKARQEFDQALGSGVPEADQAKLNYRLGKVMLLLGGDATKIVALLEKSAEADNAAEGYGMLAMAYTRLATPDLGKALKASREQLDRALRTSDVRLQTSARFQLGKLYLQLKMDKDARQMLARVGQEVPEEFYEARRLLGESYEQTGEWDNAARNWAQAREDAKLAGGEKAKVLYHLGRCYAQGQRKEAAGVFEEVVALGGPEGQAAGIRLAEQRADADTSTALTALSAALQGVHTAEDYRNPLLAVDDVRQVIEKIVSTAREKGDWPLARKAIDVYSSVAAPGKDDELAGQVLDVQGQALAADAKLDSAKQEQAMEAFRNAAAAFERAAAKTPAGPDQISRLWTSAQLFLKAGMTPRAIELLGRVTQQEGTVKPEQMGEAWLLIGNAHDTSQHLEEARAAYQKCMAYPGQFGLKAQLALASLDLADKHVDEAERALQDVLKKVRETPHADPEIQEQASFTLAHAAYQRQGTVKEDLREYSTAEQRLKGAIEQYPESEWVDDARIKLGLCYWNEARLKDSALLGTQAGRSLLNDEEKNAYQRQRDELLTMAADQYDKVEQRMLDRRKATGRLTPRESQLLKWAEFWGTDCIFFLRKYDEAVRRCNALAGRYERLPEEMIALSQVWQTYSLMRLPEKAAETLVRMKTEFAKIPDAAFDGSLNTHQRAYWEKWIDEASKPAIAPTPPPSRVSK
jgi:tetratricopeptide (TPR) repeat protein